MTAVLLPVLFGLAALLPWPSGGYTQIIQQNRGAVLVVAFWATWCEPCREELPRLQTIAHASRGRIRLITISADEPEQANAAAAFLEQAKITGDRYRLSGADVISQVNPQWSGVLPAVFVYEGSGAARGMITGQMDWGKLNQLTSPVDQKHTRAQRH